LEAIICKELLGRTEEAHERLNEEYNITKAKRLGIGRSK
jgi:hypothetical protein